MSDQVTRTAQRNATTVADAASLLAERLRRGDLDGVVPCGKCEGKGATGRPPSMFADCLTCHGSGYASGDEALALLAFVGHQAALAVKALRWKCGKCQIDAGEFATTETFARHSHRCPLRDLATWAGGLTRWGQRVAVRAAVLAGRAALPLPPSVKPGAWKPLAERALDAAQVWVDDPSGEHWRAWSAAGAAGRDRAAWVVIAGADTRYPTRVAAKVAGEAEVREAIRDGITAWILGAGGAGT